MIELWVMAVMSSVVTMVDECISIIGGQECNHGCGRFLSGVCREIQCRVEGYSTLRGWNTLSPTSNADSRDVANPLGV